MSRGGHNWKGGGTVEGTRSLDVMKLSRAGYLAGGRSGGWQWTYKDGWTASIGLVGGKDAITLNYRIQMNGQDWQSVEQKVPIHWSTCRFGGERPWFICNVRANGLYCGRRVAQLYGAGRLFACRHCYRLGYSIQRNDPMGCAHQRLARLHRKLKAEYDFPDMPPPPKPKWMRWKTYSRIAKQIEEGHDNLDAVFIAGSQRLLARLERSKQRGRTRR